MKPLLVTLIYLSLSSLLIGQSIVDRMTTEQFVAPTESINPFSKVKSTAKSSIVNHTVIEQYELLSLDASSIGRIRNQKSASLELTIPVEGDKSVDLELIPSGYEADAYNIYASSEREKYIKMPRGQHYWGRVKGDTHSMVALSIYDGEITGSINTSTATYSLSKLRDHKEHIIYQEKNLKEKPTFSCYSDDIARLAPTTKGTTDKTFNPSNAVRMYIEVDNDIYEDFGSITATANFINAALNQVAILYANESINFLVNEMVIWDTADPYTGPNTGDYMDQFQDRLNGNFNGDLAHLIGNRGSGGVAYLDGLCGNKNFALGYSGINNTFNNVPAYSWTVNVLTHEIGHNLGSEHTHSCSWNGNNTAIDGCGPASGNDEGCDAPVPQQGGTIMSYCHLTNVGVDFNLGFGPQPGDLIRDKVYNADCLTPSGSTCDDGIRNGNETGVDCGGSCAACPPSCTDGIQNGTETSIDCGGSCDPCPEMCSDLTEIQINIKLDDYPEETSWELKNSSNTIIANGGTYGDRAGGSMVQISHCIADGCYTFIIRDTYSDGICCAFGEGNYSVTIEGETVLSGAAFTASESNDFCIGTDTSSCNDGIQNGNETGVDCGGTDCTPCETCTDGVQNGSETGIDCGGADCSPCETCTDGIQNGTETGIDCGGTDCVPCETCSDSIQNGSETDVDCGGSDCTPCETCSDGVLNGSETDIDCGGTDCSPCETSSCNDGIQNGNETDVDCGGPDCTPCDSTSCSTVILEIKFDNYPKETSWTLARVDETIIAQGDNYGNQPDGSTLLITDCLEDGCYIFTISDAYGDGICCAYGDGSYTIYSDDIILGSGGTFDRQDRRTFCIGDLSSNACDDGIINGDETGVDCGGSCAPCDTGNCTYTTVLDSDFEVYSTDWIDGGGDCRRSFYDRQFADSGDYCYRLRDDSYSSTLKTTNLDLSSTAELTIEFSYITRSMDNSSEGFILEISDDGGITYDLISDYYRGEDFQNGQRNFESVTYSGNMTRQSVIRFSCDGSTNSDYVYIDDVTIMSCGSSMVPPSTVDEVSPAIVETASLSVYPNPADTDMVLTFQLGQDTGAQLSLYDLSGRVVYSEESQLYKSGSYQIDISVAHMREGMYYAVMTTADSKLVQKFVVLRQ